MIFSFEKTSLLDGDDEKSFSPELPKNCSRIMAAEDLNAYKVNMLINHTDTAIKSFAQRRSQSKRR